MYRIAVSLYAFMIVTDVSVGFCPKKGIFMVENDLKNKESGTEELQFGSGFAVQSFFEREVEAARRKKNGGRAFAVIAIVVLLVAAAVVVLSQTVFPVFRLMSDSMYPAFQRGDILVVMKTKDVSVDDVCCYEFDGYTLMHRVIATGGGTVAQKSDGRVTVNGIPLPDAYGIPSSNAKLPLTIPEGSIFVLSDTSLTELNDGRAVVDSDCIIGRVVFRIWPLGSFGLVSEQEGK